MPNPYTGTDNDPISAAQHQFLGKDWERFFASLGQRVRMSASGPGAPVALGGAGRTDGVFAGGSRIGDADTARSLAVNGYLGQLTDENKLRHQADLDMAAHNRAVDASERDRQTAQRGLAIANDPRSSAFGRPIARLSQQVAGAQPAGAPPDEAQFRNWYAQMSRQHGLSPDPDSPEQLYDYRAAFSAGASPDKAGHWPSQFKQAGHPNEIVGGFNTRTGERAPGTKQASEAELVALGWDPAAAKQLSKARSYTTLRPNPNEAQPPVNRQALAAQMAPGQIAPPAPPPPVTFGKPEKMPVMVDGKPKDTWTRTGSDGQLYGMDRRPIDPASIAPPSAESANPDVADAVTAMKEGTVPPQLPGRSSKDYIAIQAEAKRQGYDLASAATDWNATQKHIQTMNGAQQLRLNQAVNSLPEMLDTVDTLAGQWKGGRFPVLNKANLALAKGGAYGQEAASVANQLDAMIADVTADLGNVYMGGNSPTERALELAGKALNGEWDEKVLKDMVTLAKKNVQIRQNSIRNTGVSGASADNPYGNQRGDAAPPAPAGFVDMLDNADQPLHVPAADVDKVIALGGKRKGG